MPNAPAPESSGNSAPEGEGRKKLSLSRKPAPAPQPASRDAGRSRPAGGGAARSGSDRGGAGARSGGGRPGAGRPSSDRAGYGDRGFAGGDRREGSRDGRPGGDRPSYGRPGVDRGSDRGGYGDRGFAGGDRREGGRDGRPGGDRPSFGRPSADRGDRPSRDGDRFDRGNRPERGDRGDRGAARPGGAQRPTPANVWRADETPRTMQTAAAQAQNVQLKAEGQLRVNKRLSDLGLCSRREGDAWIENGWVLVNGEVATMGQLVSVTDKIEIQREAQEQQAQQVTILLHKPMGYVSGQAEDGHEPAVVLVNPPNHWREDHSKTRFNFSQLKGLAPCGRLDIDSVGLLVLTQDGRVAKHIIGEDSEVDKEYLVRVVYDNIEKDVQAHFPADKLALLRHGLSLDGEALLPAEVDWQNPEQLRFVLREGKKRQIRRMCEAVGLHVVGLKRIRIGKVVLGNLPVGQWRYLGPNESF
ncbi:pseudouridine synthase [Comamonas sp. J-3]|uniref:pseudouridine synthase n=1 Tax=Comamonas trifloxystrobinivorans TaxID=3350256 RepID=UPI003726A184